MRHRWCVWLWLLVFGALCSAAQSGGDKATAGEQYLGTWTGTWEGSGASGGFEVTLEKKKDGALGGSVSVTGEPTYKAVFKTVSFDGSKMSATYDFPLEETIEVVLGASFEAKSAAGTWTAREKASGNEVISGTWTVTRKQQ